MKSILKNTLFIIISSLFFLHCGGSSKESTNDAPPPKSMVAKEEVMDPMKNKGIGPIKSVKLEKLDMTMVKEGKVLFENLCTACHKVNKRFIGPAPTNIIKRRTPEWIMNMIMNPDEMTKKDPIAKQLLIEANGAPMSNQNVSREDARKILEYFRTL